MLQPVERAPGYVAIIELSELHVSFSFFLYFLPGRIHKSFKKRHLAPCCVRRRRAQQDGSSRVRFIQTAKLAGFQIHLEIVDEVDVVGAGFDAGIRFEQTLPEDMVGVRIGSSHRWVVVGAPTYFARRAVPDRPFDLAHHDCIRQQFPSGRVLK